MNRIDSAFVALSLVAVAIAGWAAFMLLADIAYSLSILAGR